MPAPIATPNATPSSRKYEDEFPVSVFRRTATRGWEMYHDTENNDTEVTAAPRRGCVEVRRLRLRIRLFPGIDGAKNSEKDGGNKEYSTSSSKCQARNTTVVRRLDTILLSTRQGTGAVVLKFHTLVDCHAFSDRLLELNQEHSSKYQETEQRDNQQPLRRPDKRRRAGGTSSSTALAESTAKTETLSSDPSESVMEESTLEARKRRDVLSHIVRLLHDNDFMDFVDQVEGSLAREPDCAGILAALGRR